jgi:dienelactone hydrolase
VAYDESWTSKRPCVLVSHQWSGQSDVERKKAEELARLGYVGFAIDVYGKGVRGGLLEDNSKLMHPFIEDRAMLRRRILAALAAAQKHPMAAPDRIGAIGYCFGGLCALDLARSAAPGVKGVVSFHGVLHPPNIGQQAPITAKILILHGYDDPLAPPEHVLAIARELTEADADWQLHAYGHTMHAFTAQGVNLPERGLKYNAAADQRSWTAMKNFFDEAL